MAGFTSVVIGSTFHAEITHGSAFKVSTSCDDNVTPYVQVTKEGTTLKIGLQPGKSYQLKTRLKAEISLPKLASLETSGASRSTLKGFRSQEPLWLKVSGASHVDGAIEAGDVDFDVSGASTLALTGSGGAARLTGSAQAGTRSWSFHSRSAHSSSAVLHRRKSIAGRPSRSRPSFPARAT